MRVTIPGTSVAIPATLAAVVLLASSLTVIPSEQGVGPGEDVPANAETVEASTATLDADQWRLTVDQVEPGQELRFEANDGVADVDLDFVAAGPDYEAILSGDEVVVVFDSESTADSISMELVDAAQDPEPESPEPAELIDPTVDDAVAYRDVYPGVDVVYEPDGGELRYSLLLDPGIDPGTVALGFDSTTDLQLQEDGSVQFTSKSGRGLVMTAPVTFQTIGGERQAVDSSYSIEEDGTIAFAIGAHDPALPLVIDPTFVAKDAAGGPYAGASTISLDVPAEVSSGDVLVAQVAFNASAAAGAPGAPAGWTEVSSFASNGLRQTIYWRVAGGSEPSSYSFNLAGATNKTAAGSIVVYADVNTGSPINSWGTQTGSGTANVIAPSVTTTVDGATLVAFYAVADDGSLTPPATMNERWDVNSGSNGGATSDETIAAAADEIQSAAGATGTRTATAEVTASWVATMVALAPSSNTLVVNSTADVVDQSAGNGSCDTGNTVGSDAECTLRAAVQESNSLTGEQVIVLPAGTYNFTRSGAFEDGSSTGDLDINADVTITGAGPDLVTIDANNLDRVIELRVGTLNLSGMTLTGGDIGSLGGGIFVDSSDTLNITDVVIDANNSSSNGGGVYAEGTLVAIDSRISNNTTSGNGGGVYVQGALIADDSTIDGNSSSGDGGGLRIDSGATTTLTNVTVSGNDANGQGGGIDNAGSATVVNATITGNDANTSGGGLQDRAGSTSTLRNTIIAGNTTSGSNPDAGGTVESVGNNIVGEDGSSGGWVGSDQLDVDPLLSALADNGGPTQTHAIGLTSPALDAGTATSAPAADQRGVARPLDGDGDTTASHDIGAYEYEPATGGGGGGTDLLMITSDGGFSNGNDSAKKALFESWGWTVTGLAGASSAGAYSAAAAANDVLFMSDTAGGGSAIVADLDIGVVVEILFGWVNTLYSGTDATGFTSNTALDLIDNSHYITSPLSTGSVAIYTSAADVNYWNSATAALPAGVTVLAESPTSTNHGALLVAETGATLYSANTAPNRRVWFPSDFANPSNFTTDFETLMERSLDWAAGATSAGGPVDPVVFDNVQSGTTVLGNGSSSTTATIAAVDTSKAFLTYTIRGSDADPDDLWITGELTNATTLTFDRYGTGGDVTIEWSVTEFASGVTVQRGSTNLTAGTVDVTISSADLATSFPIINQRASGALFGQNDFPRAALTSPTNLRLSIASTSANVAYWQVVTYNDASVQSGLVSFGSGDASVTASPASVDTSKAWLTYSTNSDGGTATNIGQKLVRGLITDATTLTFDRSSTGQPMDVQWYLVEFADDTEVQHANVAFGSSDTTQDVTIAPVDTDRSISTGGYLGYGGRSAYTADDNPGVGWFTTRLTSPGNLRVQRDAALATADLGWSVIHWPCADSDSDGLTDCREDANTDADNDPATNPGPDADGDTLPNYLDADDDGDGTATASENADPNSDGDPRDARDSDRDGQPDYLDNPTLETSGTVASEQKISDLSGDLAASLDDGDEFGGSSAAVGDLDGDGIVDMVIGARGDDDGGSDRGAVYVLFLNADGTVRAEQKISDTDGGLAAVLDDDDRFGEDVTSPGDIDGDGVNDIAVGASKDDDGGGNRGAVYVLFLNADGTVKAEQKISSTTGGLVGPIDDNDQVGYGLAGLGDIDGDGIPDLAIGAYFDADGGSAAGAVYVLFLNSDGTVRDEQKIGPGSGGFTGPVENADFFGLALAGLGDVNGDGTGDLAASAYLDDDGGSGRGAVYILMLDTDGTVKAEQKISDTQGGLTETLGNSDNFGRSVAATGDIDGDGVADVVVGATGDDDGGSSAGAVYVLFLNTDGSVRAEQKISDTFGGFNTNLAASDTFGVSAAGLGDLDGDGTIGLVIGANRDGDGGTTRGAVYVLDLALASCTVDSDSDGLFDCWEDADTDGDGDPSTNPGPNTDGDGFANYLDADDDDDGTPTASENPDPNGDGDPRDALDADWDGQVDYLDGPTSVVTGAVGSEQKISALSGGLTGPLQSSDLFGTGTTSIGDLDGDGIVDLAVGAYQDDDGGSNRGAVYILLMNADGTVKAEQKISSTQGGLTGPLDDSDKFGSNVASLGDLDGDGRGELAVGAYDGDDGGTNRGELYILFLNADGTVKAEQKISDTEGGFATTLSNSDEFGHGVSGIGDLDGDGINDLAVGAARDDDGGASSGAVYVLLLNSDGTVKAEQKIGASSGGLTGPLETSDQFGLGLSALGDLDGDGNVDLVVGAPKDDDGASSAGAVYVLFLNSDGTVKAEQKISASSGGLTSSLDASDFFGIGVTAVGDLDRDGVTDLAVGANGDDDDANAAGAVHILFLNSDGTVKNEAKINSTAGGLTGPLSAGDSFGHDIASLGDQDGDGSIHLAIGAEGDDDGASSAGAVYVIELTLGTTVAINSTGDSADANPGDNLCDTGGTNADGDTECTLRAAIEETNASAQIDAIDFAIPATDTNHSAGIWTITPTTAALDSVTANIDATTQSGWSGIPVVVLDGSARSGSPADDGLDIVADGLTITGLSVVNWPDDGVLTRSDNVTFSDLWLGVLPDSTTGANGTTDIYILGTAANATIDSVVVAAAGNDNGINVGESASGTTIQDSWIGVTPSFADLGAAGEGLFVSGTADVVITGTTFGHLPAASIGSSSGSLTITGSAFGTDLTGTQVMPVNEAIWTSGSGTFVFGGTGVSDGNIVRNTAFDAVTLFTGFSGTTTILGNSISGSGSLAINLVGGTEDAAGVTANDAGDGDTGPNDLLNFPVITSATVSGGTVTVNYTLDAPAGDYRIEFFTNPLGANASGYGDGETFLQAESITHTGSGSESFSATYSGSAGQILTATTTLDLGGGSYGASSEFSAAPTVIPPEMTVNSTGDTGDDTPGDSLCATGGTNAVGDPECTLRAAIEELNGAGSAGATIGFAIPTSDPGYSTSPTAFTITPAGPLPAIAQQLTIDGATQTQHATLPVIVLDGSSAGSGTDGLYLDTGAGGSTINALTIHSFDQVGIQIDGSDGHIITGNVIGLDADGTTGRGNRYGLYADTSVGLTVGGDTAAERNIVSDNDWGLALYNNSHDAVITGNYIGTDATGLLDRGNQNDGLFVVNGSSRAQIGGSAAGETNVIAGNNGDGIYIGSGSIVDPVIEDNLIGVGTDGTTPLANNDAGINLGSGSGAQVLDNIIGPGNNGITLSVHDDAIITGNSIGTDQTGSELWSMTEAAIFIGSSSDDNTIGGTTTADANVIRNGGGGGVVLIATAGSGNAVIGNSIVGNTGPGIDLGNDGVTANDGGDVDSGPNDVLNRPAISRSVETAPGSLTTSIRLDVPAGTYRIELFEAQAAGAIDDSGAGEGEVLLGTDSITHTGSGSETFTIVHPGVTGDLISATATEDLGGGDWGSTSEFSRARIALSTSQVAVNDAGDSTDLTPGDGVCDTGGVNTEDEVACTLRAAIEEVNGAGGIDTIRFDLPASDANHSSGVWTIAPALALPSITEAVTLDGTTQPEWTSTPVIELDGTSAGATNDGLSLDAAGVTIRGLAIGRFGRDGVVADAGSTSGSIIVGNHIGIDPTGLVDRGNGRHGIVLRFGSASTVVGGVGVSDQNIVSGNGSNGVYITSSDGNTVIGNLIGTDISGLAPIANDGDGVYLTGTSANNIVGQSGAGNVLAGNGDDGLESFSSAAGNTIGANVIGLGLDGDTVVANARHGIVLYDRANNTVVGGSIGGEGNIVSGNGEQGIHINGNSNPAMTANSIVGNLIGVDTTGALDRGNGEEGIVVFGGATATVIGGATAASANTISGNGISAEAGVLVEDAATTGTVIRHNRIGTNLAGTLAIPNAGAGIQISVAPSVNILDNLIAGNAGDGIQLDGATGTVIQTNHIGTDSGATLDLGNVGAGITTSGAASSATTIGGTGAGEGNVIANNASGVTIEAGTGNGHHLLGNQIFANDGIGIDLDGGVEDADGVTANDGGDGDSGANDLLNFPVIGNGRRVAGDLVVNVTLDAPAGNYRIELFGNTTQDPSGYGEGETALGGATVTHTGAGVESFTVTVTSVATMLTATATEDLGAGSFGSTSEFSAAVPSPDLVLVNSTGDGADAVAGDGQCDTGGTNSDGDPECTLRAAIEESNDPTAPIDDIWFDIPTSDPNHTAGIWTITPTSAAFDAVTANLDATTQPGWVNTPVIVLDGSSRSGSPTEDGLHAAANGITVAGLSVVNWPDDAVHTNFDNVTFSDLWLGVLPDETTAANGSSDMVIYGAAANTTIDSVVMAASGTDDAVNIDGTTTGTTIADSWFGITPTFTDLGPPGEGVILAGSADLIITGSTFGHFPNAAIVPASSGALTVTGSAFGTDLSGTQTMPIGQAIWTDGPGDITFGGTGGGEGNVVKNTSYDAINLFTGFSGTATILGNSFSSNGGLAIDLVGGTEDGAGVTANDPGDADTGPNGLLNYPVLTSAVISGSVAVVDFALDAPAGDYRIEFFANPGGGDPSGFGEGQEPAGAAIITHAGSGSQTGTAVFPATVGALLSATATVDLGGGSYGATSEFSALATATSVNTPMVEDRSIRRSDVNAFGGLDPISAEVSGLAGLALQLDGVDDRLVGPGLDITDNALTIEGLVRLDSLSGTPRVVSKLTSASSPIYELYVDGGTGEAVSSLRLGGSTVTVRGGALSTATWHYLASSWDGAELVLFVDGVEADRVTAAGSLAVDVTTEATIGGDRSGSQTMDGLLDDVRISHRAKSAEEIAARYLNMSDPSVLVAVGAEQTSVPEPWTVDGTRSRSGGFSLQAPETASSDAAAWAVALGIDEPGVVFESWWWASTDTGIDLGSGTRAGTAPTDQYEAALTSPSGWEIRKRSGAAEVTDAAAAGTPSTGTWVKVELWTDQNGDSRLLIDGVEATGWTAQGNTLSSGSISLRAGLLPSGQEWSVDDARGRRLITPEPLATLGALDRD